MNPTRPPSADATQPAATVAHMPEQTDRSIDSPAASLVGVQIGEYVPVEVIATGVLSTIYKARHVLLDRIVALKMLASHRADPALKAIFLDEAKTAARLQHPNIVTIYDAGEFEGRLYFTMELVQGKSLHERVAYEALPSRLAAHYLEKVARAVHLAHERGILHGDLKPSNILLDEHDVPKVSDFLAARLLGPDRSLGPAQIDEMTRMGAILGTPTYMAPEQAAGYFDEIGPRSDIYSLGATLYALLTGRPPFKAESGLETLLQVMHQEPAPPRVLNPNIDPDLEAICLKCLEKNPAHRYQTAEALADDLARYLQGERVAAGSVNVLDRVGRALANSQHDRHFQEWGMGLVLAGGVIFAAHAATTILLQRQFEPWLCFWGPHVLQLIFLGLIFLRLRPHTVLPTNSAERLLWAVWGGYVASYLSMSLVIGELAHEHLASYAANAVLAGLAFFVMGAHVWGWCYLIGLVFLLAGPLFVRFVPPPLAPLWFGLLWGVSLATIGHRYWRLAQQRDAERL